MSVPARRPGNRPSRRQRQDRAYQFAMAGGGAGVAAVVTGVLAVVTSFTWSVPVLLAVVATVCYLLFRRTVGR